MKKSFSATLFLIFVFLLTSPLLFMHPAAAANSSTGFSDHFDGSTVDPAKWIVYNNTDLSGNPDYGGTVTVSNSYIQLSSNGSGFPCITSAVDPFPTTGDFTVAFDLTYTDISDWGCGLWISQGPVIGESSNSTNNNIIFQLWANNLDYNTAAIFVNLLGAQVQRQLVYGWQPAGPTQNVVLQYSGGFYTLTVNGVKLASEPSQLRADAIGFGHPPTYYIPFTPAHVASDVGGWSSFEIDQIRVLPQSNIALSTSATSTQLGLTMDFNGTLSDANGQPLADKTVVLSYQVPGVPAWNALTSSTTDSNGAFSATWLPTATGTFMIQAAWSGDDANSGASDAKNVSVAEGSGQNLLFAESNSTLTALDFNSTSNSVSFTVSGPSGTTGYVRFLLSKSMITNMSAVQVAVDGQQTSFNASSLGDMEVLYFVYHHSTHDVTVSLSKTAQVPELTGTTILILLAAASLIAVAIKRKSRRFKK